MAWTKPASNGKVRGCWRDHTGKERSKTFTTKTETLRYAKKMEVEIDAGVRRDHDLGKMTSRGRDGRRVRDVDIESEYLEVERRRYHDRI
jgi:hypothetical protein